MTVADRPQYQLMQRQEKALATSKGLQKPIASPDGSLQKTLCSISSLAPFVVVREWIEAAIAGVIRGKTSASS
jgi:hypothetical protein